MEEQYFIDEKKGISGDALLSAVKNTVSQYPHAKKVLIIPPDYTRCFSFAGEITGHLYRLFREMGAQVDVMPALGTHVPMSEEEREVFFRGEVPPDAILVHNWQTDCHTLGNIPAWLLEEISQGQYAAQVPVQVDYRFVENGYDVIFCPGQVVPHEAAGMAGYSKSLFIGIGGKEMINQSHMLSAVCDCEKAMGVMNSPLRRMFDYAQERFIDGKFPVVYLQTVVTMKGQKACLNGLFIGSSRKPYEKACELSIRLNINHLNKPAKKVVAYADPEEMHSLWISNKAIYRTRMAIADGGELLVIAPGVEKAGESPDVDRAVRRFGYRGRKKILEWYHQGLFEGDVLTAGCLMLGSSDGRFRITYATRPENMARQEIESLGFAWMDCEEALEKYNPDHLKEGFNTMPEGEEVYFVGKPALGLWKYEKGEEGS
ncbi:MAG: DUF2088 domain-containing protein [Lachnospiraceae bacterium]|nr:DUF2088 domain-containing protein [Lachnospiraceae bacterium]